MLDLEKGMSGDGKLIWSQIPTSIKRKYNARDGAFLNNPAYLSFTVGARGRPLHKIQIMLTPYDLYDLAYVTVDYDSKVETLGSASGIFCDVLGDAIDYMITEAESA